MMASDIGGDRTLGLDADRRVGNEAGFEQSFAFCHVASRSGAIGKVFVLTVPISGLYLLAAPLTPAEAIEVAAERTGHQKGCVYATSERFSLVVSCCLP
jgi:hypothetical protein